jgi:uncharacterized phage-associated protein
MSLHFKMNWAKAVEAVHYLASIHPGITPFYIAKIFYFADKEHMVDWGRPICGDVYIAMENGPVPSNIYDLIKREQFLDDDIVEEFDRRIRKNDRALHSKTDFNAVALSPSDMEYLRAAERVYGHMSFSMLRDLVHRERAWLEAWESSIARATPMKMDLMIGDDVEHRNELIKEIRWKATYAG